MKVLKFHNPIYIDIDDTLVLWDSEKKDKVMIECYGVKHYLVPHKRHIDFLKSQKQRNREIVLWSQNGYLWAEAVAKALNIEEYVDACITKPLEYVDDLNCQSFMGQNIYLKDYEINQNS